MDGIDPERIDVVVSIEGREAVPVRVLPFVTRWILSPDLVALTLGLKDEWGRFAKETLLSADDPAYRGSPQMKRTARVKTFYCKPGKAGGIGVMFPAEWDDIISKLKALSARLKETGKTHEEQRADWRRESIPLLPPGTFVWRDEFAAAFKGAYEFKCYINRFHNRYPDERDGDLELIFDPVIPRKLHGIVMEGFDGQTGVDFIPQEPSNRYLDDQEKIPVTEPGTPGRPDVNTQAAAYAIKLHQSGDASTKHAACKKAQEHYFPNHNNPARKIASIEATIRNQRRKAKQ